MKFIKQSVIQTAIQVTLMTASVWASLEPVPIGNDFQVNSFVAGDQSAPVVARDSSGDFVAIWQSQGQDGSAAGIYGQRFNANGSPAGLEFLVGTTTLGEQDTPAVAISDSGLFVVVWESTDDDEGGVFARFFDSQGLPLTSEIVVNSSSVLDLSDPAIAINEAGTVLIVWQSSELSLDTDGWGIAGRVFDDDGSALTPEFLVNSATVGDQIRPAAAALDETNEFVVVWEGLDADNRGIFLQRFSQSGMPLGAEVPVNTITAGDQIAPKVAASGRDLDVGDQNIFAVVWQGPDADGSGIWVRRFDDSGAPLDTDELVNLTTAQNQQLPDVSFDDGLAGDGVNFIVTWTTPLIVRGGIIILRGRRIGPPGALAGPPGDEFDLASGIGFTRPAVAADAGGRFVCVWQGTGQDGSGTGVLGRRFDLAAFADGFESGDTLEWSVTIP
jgi:hypothetical protein